MPTIYTTYVAETLFDDKVGSGTVIVLRKKSPLKVEAGVFLVDALCLGISDAVFYVGTESEVMENLINDAPSFREMSGSYGRKLIEEAIVYAKRLGFAPHKDYKKASRVFGGLKAADDLEGFTFGRDGKPFYIQSENHDANDALRIVTKLRKVCGEDGFDFICKMEDDEDDYEEEVRLLLSEGWMSSTQQEHPTDEPSRAAKRKFIEFADKTENCDEVLLNSHAWEPSDGITTFDQMLQAVDIILESMPDDMPFNEGEARQVFMGILMYLMNLVDKDEEEVEAEFRILKAADGTASGFTDFARDLLNNDTMRSMLTDLVHPSPEITILPMNLEVIDEESGHYLLICLEECDPDVGNFGYYQE